MWQAGFILRLPVNANGKVYTFSFVPLGFGIVGLMAMRLIITTMAENMNMQSSETRESLIAEIKRRVEDKILEQTNADLLIKLIRQADTLTEAISIAQLGTTYKRTGLHYDKRIEKFGNTIKYFKKNEELSFSDGTGEAPNKLIIGDNYDALQNLLIEYRGKVDVIYIDPPYAKDSMGEFAETNYENAITRDNLLSMLYPRLVLAQQLLAEEGTIFCSIDDRNHAYVKCLMDEVFQEKNFEGQIHWRRRHNQPNDKTKLIGKVAEHILVYSKNLEYHKAFGIGKVGLTGKFTNPDNDPRGPWASKPWKTGSGQSGTRYPITTPTGKVLDEEWMGDEDTYKMLLEDGRIIFPDKGKGSPRKKYFKSERQAEGQCASNWWPNKEFGCNQDATDELKALFGECPFDNPKPTSLIKAIIQLGTIKEEAVILDFFAGSGTSGQAAAECNKEGMKYQFILCQVDEKTETTPNGIVKDVTSKRLKRTMTGSCYDGTNDFKWMNDNEPLGGSLDVYEIASVSNAEQVAGKTAFDVIDETLYGHEKFATLDEKIKWVCENFELTQSSVENDAEWQRRQEGE